MPYEFKFDVEMYVVCLYSSLRISSSLRINEYRSNYKTCLKNIFRSVSLERMIEQISFSLL